MTQKERMMQYLKDEYGIETEEQFKAAYKAMEPINIGLFTMKGCVNNERGNQKSNQRSRAANRLQCAGF